MRRFINIMIDGMAFASLVFIFAAALLTCIDVVLRHTAESSIPGLVDLTQLAMMYAVFLAISYGFARKAHVAVTILTDSLSQRVNRFLSAAWWLAGAGLLSVLAYAAFEQAVLVASYGDVSQNIRIPMIWYWLPVVVGLIAAMLGSLWAMAQTVEHPDIVYLGEPQ
ncbi:TRAP transporter small permease [Fluviibacterium sp. DFM31]|uniref:TRAP transporter small permease protein n=1 Tax=Meridianimarinicoccus marinus TaxID=3231483 RepID=A0ABV3LBE4_9RHOB